MVRNASFVSTMFAIRMALAMSTVVLPMNDPIGELPLRVEVREVGRSVNQRPITGYRFGSPGGKVVVAIGSIHGHEKSGIRIARALRRQPVPAGYELWVFDTVNPDGNKLNTRQNARGVDLNRNFPALWKKQDCPSRYCSGNRPATEPETQALMEIFTQIQPQLVVFYHSVGEVLVLPSNGVAKPRAVRAYSSVSQLPIGTVFCGSGGCTGNATQWLTEAIPTSTSFVVELPCHHRCLKPREIQKHLQAFWAAAEEA